MRAQHIRQASRRFTALTAFGLIALTTAQAEDRWVPVADGAPGGVQMLLLLSDGSVMAQESQRSAPDGVKQRWFRLTPDDRGSYVNGRWTIQAQMNEKRLFYSSVVLPSGKVFVAGGEYGTNGTRSSASNSNDLDLATAEIYDPAVDVWTVLPPVPKFWSSYRNSPFGFGDSACTLLPNGNVLIGPAFPNVTTIESVTTAHSVIFDVANNLWLDGPAYVNLGNQNEASWLKLRDGSVLTIPSDNTYTSQRFIPSLNQWVADAWVPVNIYSSVGSEVGSAHLLADGKGFFIGANGGTLIYTPTGSALPGAWTRGPDVPKDDSDNPQGAPDAAAATLINGKILCAVSGVIQNMDANGNAVFPVGVNFYEYDPRVEPMANRFTRVSGPTSPTEQIPSFKTIMLGLPDGTVLYSNNSTQLYIYRPDGSPLPEGKPTITSITANPDGKSFHLTGLGLNGISYGAAYGDDAQMDSNYPLVRLTENDNGNVRFARTFNWSSTGVQTGPTPVSTDFALPNEFDFGGGLSFSLVVIANGFRSEPVSFAGPVWVDFDYVSADQRGTFHHPFLSLDGARLYVKPEGTVFLKGPRTTAEIPRQPLNQAMTLRAVGGPVTIGRR